MEGALFSPSGAYWVWCGGWLTSLPGNIMLAPSSSSCVKCSSSILGYRAIGSLGFNALMDNAVKQGDAFALAVSIQI